MPPLRQPVRLPPPEAAAGLSRTAAGCAGYLITGRRTVRVKVMTMRLSPREIEVIRQQVGAADPDAEVYLFGSRADPAQRGGDIDLLVVSDRLGFRDVLRLRREILDRIGWQQLDLVVRRRDQLEEPFAALARARGVKL